MSEPEIAIAELKPELPAITDLPDLVFIPPPRILRLFSQQIEVSERAAREVLSLPLYPELTSAQVDEVSQVVRTFDE